MEVTFEIENTEEIKKLVEDYQDKIVEEFLNNWADAVLFEAKRLLRVGKIENSNDPHGGGAFDTGGLYRDSAVIKTGENEREVRFFAPHAVWIEYGTPPHHPPVKPLQQWAKRNKLKNWKSAGWAIAKKIAKYGTPPKPFMRQASLTVERRLQEIWNETLKRFS